MEVVYIIHNYARLCLKTGSFLTVTYYFIQHGNEMKVLQVTEATKQPARPFQRRNAR